MPLRKGTDKGKEQRTFWSDKIYTKNPTASLAKMSLFLYLNPGINNLKLLPAQIPGDSGEQEELRKTLAEDLAFLNFVTK